LALTAAVGFMAGFVEDPASATEKPVCYQVALTERPALVTSATSLEDRSELLVVDPYQNRLLTVPPKGEVKPLPDVKLKKGEPFFPTVINSIEGGYLLELSDGTMARLDEHFDLKEERVPLREKNNTDFRLGSFYQWKAVDGRIFAYGSLLNGVGEDLIFKYGFFRAPLSDPTTRPELLKSFRDTSFYLVGNSYIAGMQDAAYFVVMDERPAIYRAPVEGHTVEKLSAFPTEFESKPSFKTRMTGPQTAPAHFAELAKFTVASGLYAQAGNLYLLGRKPEANGRTGWYLYKIDPAGKGRILGSVKLPTSAEHLTVVVSKNDWFLLERGPVKQLQRQDIANMVVVHSWAISALSKFPDSCPKE